jgi:hypothetical protein
MIRLAKLSFGLLTLSLLALATAPTARCDTPVNGNFKHGADHWILTGDCVVKAGSASCGQFGCLGFEQGTFPGSVVGELKTDKSYELKPGWRIQYDYTIQSSDIVFFDNERIVLVDANTGTPTTLDVFNPNPTAGTCTTNSGTRTVTIPSNVNQGHYFIILDTFEDGVSDLTGVAIDNVDVAH